MEQEGRKGFGAVMVNRPFMDDVTMTECTDDILERVCEVTMRGIYRRLRLLGAQMECNNLSDVLLTLIEKQSNEELDAENQREMQGSDRFTDYGREYAYGKKTKGLHRHSVDEVPGLFSNEHYEGGTIDDLGDIFQKRKDSDNE